MCIVEDLVELLSARTYACTQHAIAILISDHRPLSRSEEVYSVNDLVVQSSTLSLPEECDPWISSSGIT